jgi:hypothetical protein
MWMRRLLLAVVTLGLASRAKQGAGQGITSPIAPIRPDAIGRMAVGEAFDAQALVNAMIGVAFSVDPAAIVMLRGLADRVSSQRFDISQNIQLASLPSIRVTPLIAAQRNFMLLVFAILTEGKDREGRIIINETVVSASLRRYCPLYPIC